MINLINNEFLKVKKSKLIFTIILFSIAIYIINKVSDNDLFELSYNLIPFVGIFVCILFSGTICGELENGNLRYYLTKPFKRWKIYLSKMICIILYIYVSIFSIVLSVSIICRKIDYKYIGKYFTYSIPIFFIGFFILFLSTKFKSQSLCVGCSIFILCFGLIISQALFGIKFNIVEYTFLPYLDFSIFNDKTILKNMNNELGIHLSLKRGVVINLLYSIYFYIRGNHLFIKKDIKY